MGPEQPIGIGLVGLGRWGRNYLRALQSLPECRLAAVADQNTSALAQAVGVAPAVSSLDELLERVDVSAVVVATPDETHYQFVSAALAAGKDVLVEKPLALSVSDAQELVELARDRELVLAVGHTMLYHPGFAVLRVACESGRLGAIARLVMARTSAGPAHGRGSVIQDLTPHDLSMAIALKGEPVAARARLRGTAVSYQLAFGDGASAAGWAAWRATLRVRRFRVKGSAGTTVFTDEFRTQNAASREQKLDVRETPLGRQVLDFAWCCRHRARPISDGQLGLAVTRWMTALSESAARGGEWVGPRNRIDQKSESRDQKAECRAQKAGAA
jgi:predicted dehydrogenase